MALPSAPVVRRHVLIGAVCATALVVAAELLVPTVITGDTTGSIVRYGLYLTLFSLWMAWFVLTGVRALEEVE